MSASLAHLRPSARRPLAPAALREREARARLYPQRIAAGTIEQGDAEADFRAWWAIHAWLAGERFDFEISFAEMVLAASRALASAEEAVDSAAPAKRAMRETRRDGIAEILSLVQGQRDWLDELNAALRRRAAVGIAA